MKASHSRIDVYRACPYRYKLTYIDNLKAKFDYRADNALVLGTAMHLGIEKGVEEAIKEYFSHYNTITEGMVDEAIKLEILIPKVQEVLPPGGIFEEEIIDDDFKGFIDYLVEVPDKSYKRGKVYDLYDFKYSNNKKHYLKDEQLHLYKFFKEKNSKDKIRNLYYVFIPKIKIEDYNDPNYRDKLIADLEAAEIDIAQVEYDMKHVAKFLIDTKHCIEDKTFEKGTNCFFCGFKKYCNSNGEDTSELEKE